MRKLMCFFLLLALILNSYVTVGANPEVAATAAVLMDYRTGRVLWEKNAREPLSMASTTKIMTAVMALESGRVEETVTVSARAAKAPKMKMHLQAGEELRLYDLMLALMLESSNDAAVAIAEYLSGTVEDFCHAMTAKAAEIGAQDTIFETPNGLDKGEHHSTAYDLAVLTRYALGVPGFIELTNTRSAAFSSSKRSYSLHNKNRLLHEFPGANGVKTGFTNKAGHCFVGAAKRDDMQLISVVLASGWGERGKKMKWVDTKAILSHGFDEFIYKDVLYEGEPASSMRVTRSRTEELGCVYSQGLTIPLAAAEEVRVELDMPPVIEAPVSLGQLVGSAKVYVQGELYAVIPVSTMEEALRHDFRTSLERVLKGWFNFVSAKNPTGYTL